MTQLLVNGPQASGGCCYPEKHAWRKYLQWHLQCQNDSGENACLLFSREKTPAIIDGWQLNSSGIGILNNADTISIAGWQCCFAKISLFCDKEKSRTKSSLTSSGSWSAPGTTLPMAQHTARY